MTIKSLTDLVKMGLISEDTQIRWISALGTEYYEAEMELLSGDEPCDPVMVYIKRHLPMGLGV